ncbi:MAG: nuclear transport factor 2 family protein [Steroidobacteraceae bacterium]
MHAGKSLILPIVLLLSACASGGQASSGRHYSKGEVSAHDQVVGTERAFAKTMADRDFKAFSAFLSGEAIFFTGSRVEHGPHEIEATWRPYFTGAAAPFSWLPDNVQVLPSGKLALSTGPVYVQGKEVGRFNSIWRLEGAHTWRIVFDKGEAVCGQE